MCRIVWTSVVMEVDIDVESYEQITDVFVKYFYVTNIVLTGTALILTLCIIYISLQGTIINAHPRRHMPIWLAVKVSNKVLHCYIIIYC